MSLFLLQKIYFVLRYSYYITYPVNLNNEPTNWIIYPIDPTILIPMIVSFRYSKNSVLSERFANLSVCMHEFTKATMPANLFFVE